MITVEQALSHRYVKPTTGKLKGRTLYVEGVCFFNDQKVKCDVRSCVGVNSSVISYNVKNLELA